MRFLLSLLAGLLLASAASAQTQPAAPAPAPAALAAAPPTFATTKVEGTDNVYIFRYQGHQSMFVVTPEGVIATDPIGYLRPQAVTTYIDEIKKVTPAPIKYVVYSHHHYDHIAGGKPFKDLGAVFVAHKRAKEHLEQLRYPDVVIPDETVDDKRTLKLGGTELELSYVGRNHSDNSLVMRLPKEKLLFAVDFIPIEAVNFRNMPDSWPIEWEDSLKKVEAMDWDRLIPGHPYKGRLGTKADVKNLLGYMQELSTEVKQAADQGKCPDNAMKEVKLDKYQTWLNYGQYLAGNIERYCFYWGRGY
jgi:glyoxylase-like metal-dependent hydrolase (beta-lactamase superfamily II)